MTEQLCRLRLRLRGVSRLGSEASLPDFSHLPPPHRHLSDLELTQQFLSQSFRINVLSAHLLIIQVSAPLSPPQRMLPHPAHPQSSLPPGTPSHHPVLCSSEHSSLLELFFFTCLLSVAPGERDSAYLPPLFLAVSSETRTVLVLRTICGRNHRAILCGLPALFPHPNHFLHNTQSWVSPSHAPAETLPLCLPTVLRDQAVFPVWPCCPPPTLNSLHSSYADLLLSRPQGLDVSWFVCLECFSPSSSDSSSFS